MRGSRNQDDGLTNSQTLAETPLRTHSLLTRNESTASSFPVRPRRRRRRWFLVVEKREERTEERRLFYANDE